MQQISPADQTGKKNRKKVTYVPQPLPADPAALVRLPTLVAVSGRSRTSVLADIKAGKIPPGRLISPRCRVWTAGEIREMLEKLKTGCTA